jgi:hypothetical protein
LKLSHHFKTIRLFLGVAVDKKTAAQKPKKSKFSLPPPLIFFCKLQTTKEAIADFTN